MSDERMPLTSHLEELRRKLIISGVSWLVAFLACYSFAEPLFDMIASPVRAALPEGTSLVFITATEPFFTYLKIGALAGLLVSMPVIFWQIWSFVAPGLYQNEKTLLFPFVLVSTLCFGCGTYFGYRLRLSQWLSRSLSYSGPRSAKSVRCFQWAPICPWPATC